MTSNKYILKKDILIIIPAKDEYLNLADIDRVIKSIDYLLKQELETYNALNEKHFIGELTI